METILPFAQYSIKIGVMCHTDMDLDVIYAQ